MLIKLSIYKVFGNRKKSVPNSYKIMIHKNLHCNVCECDEIEKVNKIKYLGIYLNALTISDLQNIQSRILKLLFNVSSTDLDNCLKNKTILTLRKIFYYKSVIMNFNKLIKLYQFK